MTFQIIFLSKHLPLRVFYKSVRSYHHTFTDEEVNIYLKSIFASIGENKCLYDQRNF